MRKKFLGLGAALSLALLQLLTLRAQTPAAELQARARVEPTRGPRQRLPNIHPYVFASAHEQKLDAPARHLPATDEARGEDARVV